MTRPVAVAFRERIRSGAPLRGTFVKTPAVEVIEILALTGLDFICLDAEHAALGRRELDQCLAIARALSLPALVRLSHRAPDTILQALDGGAAGIVAPHVRSAADAADVARWARFGPDGRGYAGSTRQGGFTSRPMANLLRDAGEEVTVIAQIEDADAVEAIDAIAATPELDGLFFGAADLAVSLGIEASSGPKIDACLATAARAATLNGLILGAYAARPDALPDLHGKGVRLAIVSSDQGMVLSGARTLAAAPF